MYMTYTQSVHASLLTPNSFVSALQEARTEPRVLDARIAELHKLQAQRDVLTAFINIAEAVIAGLWQSVEKRWSGFSLKENRGHNLDDPLADAELREEEGITNDSPT